MSEEENENTKKWAHATDDSFATVNQQIEIGEIQTEKMSKQEKGQLLHQVVQSAQQEEQDAANPSQVPKTDEQLDSERKEQAEEIDSQVMDLEQMNFQAKDLKDFSSMTEKSAGKSFKEREIPKKAEGSKQEEVAPKKNFYEQIYEQKQKQ